MYNELVSTIISCYDTGGICMYYKHQLDRPLGHNADLHVIYLVTTKTCQEGL